MTTTFWQLVENAARERPAEVILGDEHGRELTAADFAFEAERAAAGFLALGITPGDAVSWQVPTSLEAVVVLAACARLGVVQNPVITHFRERELALITSQVDAAAVVVARTWRGFGHAAMVESIGRRPIAVDLETTPGAALRLPAGDPATLPPPPDDPAAARWVYYSSGTTADPKGARHSDETLIAGSNGVVGGLGLGRGDIYPIAWPITHIGGVAMLVAVLRRGGKLVMFESWDPVVTPHRMAAHAPTILGAATPFFLAYVDAQRAHGAEALFPDLRACVSGGAQLPVAVNEAVAAVLGVPTVVGWGLTEFPIATFETPDDPHVGTTVGQPTDDVSVRVVDGELRLKGPQCFLGYLDDRRTAEAFDDDGWFRTGDWGDIGEDGTVRILGRLKDVIIRNAENISALEVEDVIRRHATIADVAVVGVPHPRTGERACAVVVPTPGERPTLAELAAHCRENGLASFKCPEELRVFDELPRDGMGKVAKARLLELIVADPDGGERRD